MIRTMVLLRAYKRIILILVDNIVEFVDNIDDSYDGPTQSLQKEGISGADVKEQLQDSPFLSLS